MKWDPADYAAHSLGQMQWAQELIGRLELAGHEAVLDVGCGDGKVTAAIAALLPRGSVLGVDSSPDCVDYASTQHPPSQYPNLQFARMDARSLSSDRLFDIVFSNAALHWVDDHPAFLRGVERLLRPGGRLIFSCGGAGNAADIIRTLKELISRPAWSRHFDGFAFPYYFHAPDEYRDWLRGAGLRPDRVELVEKDMVHDGIAGLAGWIRTTWLPYTNRVPGPEQEDFIAELAADYLAERPLDADGRCHVQMVRLEVQATKPA